MHASESESGGSIQLMPFKAWWLDALFVRVLDGVFHLIDPLFDFAGCFIDGPFAFQPIIVGQFTNRLLYSALHFISFTVHRISPCV